MDRQRDIAMRAAARVMDRIERDGALHKDAIAEEVLAALAIEAPPRIELSLEAVDRVLGARHQNVYHGVVGQYGTFFWSDPKHDQKRILDEMSRLADLNLATSVDFRSIEAAGFGIVADPETVRDAVDTMRRECGGQDAAPEMVRRAESADAVRQGKVVVR